MQKNTALVRTTDKTMHTEKEQETRHHILAVAGQLFLARGFKGVSMKDIAEEVQVTAAALYYHFPNGKQQLFVEMFQQTIVDWHTQLYHAVEQTDGLPNKLRKYTENMLNFRRSAEIIALIRDIEEYCRDQVDRQAVRSWKQREVESLSVIFQQAIDAGEIVADIPASIYALMFQGMTMGLQTRRFMQPEQELHVSMEEIASIIVDKLLYGIAKKE